MQPFSVISNNGERLVWIEQPDGAPGRWWPGLCFCNSGEALRFNSEELDENVKRELAIKYIDNQNQPIIHLLATNTFVEMQEGTKTMDFYQNLGPLVLADDKGELSKSLLAVKSLLFQDLECNLGQGAALTAVGGIDGNSSTDTMADKEHSCETRNDKKRSHCDKQGTLTRGADSNTGEMSARFMATPKHQMTKPQDPSEPRLDEECDEDNPFNWDVLWEKLQSKGWTHVKDGMRHNSLDSCGYYVRPGCCIEKGKIGKDYFCDPTEVIIFCRSQHHDNITTGEVTTPPQKKRKTSMLKEDHLDATPRARACAQQLTSLASSLATRT